MKLELRFKNDEGELTEKLYNYESIQDAAYFMGLVQVGLRLNGVMYVLEDHYYDVEENTVVATCITQKAAEAKLALDLRNQMSPEFAARMQPPFRSDDGCGGCGGGGCH
jgi:hypothetical protein